FVLLLLVLGHGETLLALSLLEGAAADRHARLVALFVDHELHPGGLVAVGVDGHDVGDVKGSFLLDAPALGVALIGAPVANHHVEPLDDHAIVLFEELGDLAALALVFAGDDLNQVAYSEPLHHSTSGARDTIFMNRLARSSRATGPKMRVPMGSLSLLMSTALFLSNLM